MNSLLSIEQRDALQELMNIAMGQAANSMARLIDARVILSIPEIVCVSPAELAARLAVPEVFLTRQSFNGAIRGEVLSLQARDGVSVVADCLDYPQPLTADHIAAAVLDIANLLAAACLTGFIGQLDLAVRLTPPELYRPPVSPAASWGVTLLLEVSFGLIDSAFDAKVVICLEPASVQVLISRLDLILGD